MALKDLFSIDHSIWISLNKVNIRLDDLEKINNAWAAGHFVFMNIIGEDFQCVDICIFTVPSKSRADRRAEEITRSWSEDYRILKKSEIPDAWVDKAIEIVGRRMEELL